MYLCLIESYEVTPANVKITFLSHNFIGIGTI